MNRIEIIMYTFKAFQRNDFIQTPQQFSVLLKEDFISTLKMKKLRFRKAKSISVEASLPLQLP